MKRYFSSFFIAFSFYAVLAISVFYFFSNDKIIIKEIEQPKTISLNHIALEPEVKQEVPKVEEQKKEIEKVVEKTVEIAKPIIQKKIEKKVIEKKIVEKQEFETTKKVEEVATNTTVEKSLEKPMVEEKAVQSKPIIDEKKEYLDKHLAQIRELINKNVKYPERAKKLSIEGTVIVRFKILANGTVENIEIIEGHKFLQSATIEAIEEASKKFPKSNSNIEVQIAIEYKLI
jgi:protein TonB